jgi:PleD family two-component response regulator
MVGSVAAAVLDPFAFQLRLGAELARIHRSGGFLSLALLGTARRPDVAPTPRPRLERLADRLKGRVRVHDVLAIPAGGVAVLMPDTDMMQATRAAERLLGVGAETDGRDSAPFSAGVATVYGAVEWGVEALPAAAAEALDAAAPGAVERSRSLEGRPQVLVVDDDMAFAGALADAVSERGWEGHPCTDPRDALQRVRDDSYSAMFVDLVLPGSNGVEILRAAMAHNTRRPAVLMSGTDAQPDIVLEALSLGPVIFMAKPLRPGSLDSALLMFRAMLPGAQPRR